MESNATAADNTVGTPSGGGFSKGGNNNNENTQVPEPRPGQTSGVVYSVRGGRRPLPPPFLQKIYDIIDDPSTNSIISWGPNNTSFIIFDQLKFTSELLPKYFRHSNFSSFVYQLNNYGFKKISWDRLEYENQWFQAGKKQWLKHIKRRNQIPQPEITSFTPPNDSKMEIDEEIELLRTEQISMKEEIQKLRRQRDELAKKFTDFPGNLNLADSKNEEIIIKLFAKKLLQNVSQRRENGSNVCIKRQKLTSSGYANSENVNILEQDPDNGDVSGHNDVGTQQIQEELVEIQPEGQVLSSSDDSGSSNQDDETDTFPGSAENCAYWKKILDDDSEHENQETELAENNPDIMIKLEDLMTCNTPVEGEHSIQSL